MPHSHAQKGCICRDYKSDPKCPIHRYRPGVSELLCDLSAAKIIARCILCKRGYVLAEEGAQCYTCRVPLEVLTRAESGDIPMVPIQTEKSR